MMHFPIFQEQKTASAQNAQLLCLLLAGMLEFFVMTAGTMFDYKFILLLRIGSAAACLAFWLAVLLQPSRRILQKNVILGAVMMLWFLTVELLHRYNGMAIHRIPLFCCIYLLAFPFAAITQDQHRQRGIRMVAGMYLAAGLILLAGSVLLLMDHVPGFLQNFAGWDGTRLEIVHHSNITARIWLIAIGFCLGFSSQCQRYWAKGLLVMASIGLLAGIALSNSRACILAACLLLAGNVFFVIFRGRGNRFLPGAAAAVLVAAALFLSANALFQWNSLRLLHQASGAPVQQESVSHCEASDQPAYSVLLLSNTSGQSAETEQPEMTVYNPQGSWLSDLFTLNSRTRLWAEVFWKIQDHPAILLWGTDSTDFMGRILPVDHTHNAWLETLLRLGIPGLIMSLIFTWQAISAAFCLLFRSAADLWQKNIAMLMLCLLVTSMLEPCLFFTEAWCHFIDFLFFLCLGYLTLWQKQTAHTR